MRAQGRKETRRGSGCQLAAKSYTADRSRVPLLIREDKLASHEPGVCMEPIRRCCSGLRVPARPAEEQIDLAHKAVEVRDRGWIAPFRVGSGGIGRRGRTTDRPWEIKVEPASRSG